MATYQAIVVDMAGVPYGELENAHIGDVEFELNAAGGFDITLATTDPDALLLQPGREVQIWRDGAILHWGPIVRIQAGVAETTWQCAGILWYLDHRYFGRADRINQCTDGDFEAGEGAWVFAGGVGHTIVTSPVIEGTKALRLVGSATVEQYAQWNYTHVQSYPTGDFMTIAANVWIDSGDYVAPAPFSFGLYLEHRRAGVLIFDDTTTLDDDTPQDDWVPFETGVHSVLQGDTLEVRIYAPDGSAVWDLVTITYMESLSAGYPVGVDVADIIEAIVLYAQDQAPYNFGHGKSDLNVTVSAAATGVVKSWVSQFEEHANIGDALVELAETGIFDYEVVVTGTTRTFTTFVPRKGSLYGSPLVLDTDLSAFTWSWDGEQAATSVVITGPGDGPDRPEGGAADLAAFGGLTLEHVETAHDDVTIGELDARAAEVLAVMARPEIIEATGYPGQLTDLEVGDTATLQANFGYLQVNAIYRVVRIKIDPRTDQRTLTFNAEP
jgi:hypothetical protein